MTGFRFCHIDHLRLGSPLEGLSACPEWLRSAAASAVRESVQRALQAAISHDCRFVLLGGRITERVDFRNAAVAWLAQQAATLARHGISLLVPCTSAERAVWSRFAHITCVSPEDSVRVAPRTDGSVRFATEAMPRDPHGILQFERRDSATDDGAPVYVVVPDIRAGALTTKSSAGGVLMNSAGAPQAVSPAETGSFGCQIVDVDVRARTLTSRFHPLSPIRFESVSVSVAGLERFEDMVTAITAATGPAVAVNGATVIADWHLHDWHVQSMPSVSVVDETQILAELRRRYRNGHAGVWPRRLRFDSLSCRGLRRPATAALSQLAAAVARREETACDIAATPRTAAERLRVATGLIRRAA